MPRLRRVDCASPGIVRNRGDRGFVYTDPSGEQIHNLETLERIRALAIPPAWTDVWICVDPEGHLQAVGTDAAGRRQYRYHDRWRQRRDQLKFDEMLKFARALPKLRRIASEHLATESLTRERVLACAVRLLDRGFFRVGGEEYAEGNGSYGLATLEKQHVKLVEDGALVFDYPAKSGRQRVQQILDPDVYEVVKVLKARRGGHALLRYREGGEWVDVRSTAINAYIKEHIGDDFSAKDFRTWHGTVLAAVALAVSERATTKTGRMRAIARAIEEVSVYLGNTPAVCRTSYIDPRVFDRYRTGATISPAIEGLALLDEDRSPATQGVIEEAVLELLEDGVVPERAGTGRPAGTRGRSRNSHVRVNEDRRRTGRRSQWFGR